MKKLQKKFNGPNEKLNEKNSHRTTFSPRKEIDFTFFGEKCHISHEFDKTTKWIPRPKNTHVQNFAEIRVTLKILHFLYHFCIVFLALRFRRNFEHFFILLGHRIHFCGWFCRIRVKYDTVHQKT